jgi:4-diphosphocytidyl-2-methyl-D-erithritol synthase
MDKKIYAIVTAGGSGIRMGGNIAKQFIELGGSPILLRTIEQLVNFCPDIEIILVINSEYKEFWKSYCLNNNILIRHTLVSGGITRFHSVKNAMKYIPDDAIVCIHDGVRPFINKELLNRLFEYDFLAKGYDGLIPVLPSVDSVREKIFDGSNNMVDTQVVDRDKFLFVQTPQLFGSSQLKKAYTQPFSPDFTDDASVMEKAGYKIAVCEGSRFNIKITTSEDLKIGESYLSLFNS